MTHPEAAHHRIEGLLGEGQSQGIALLEIQVRIVLSGQRKLCRREVHSGGLCTAQGCRMRQIARAASDVQHALSVGHVGGVQHRLRRLRGDLRRQCVISRGGFWVLPALPFEGCKAQCGISHHTSRIRKLFEVFRFNCGFCLAKTRFVFIRSNECGGRRPHQSWGRLAPGRPAASGLRYGASRRLSIALLRRSSSLSCPIQPNGALSNHVDP